MKHLSLIAVVAILFILAVPTYIGMAKSDLSTPPSKWHEACQWLKDNTPQDALIIAFWDYGYWIEYLAEREAYVTPGQNVERVTYVAQLFLSYQDWIENWWDVDVYIVIDYDTAYNFKGPLSVWAGMDNIFINWGKTLVQRLYSGGYVSDDYRLVYDNGVKIWEVTR